MNTIKNLLKEYFSVSGQAEAVISSGQINLGYVNGWREREISLYRGLEAFKVANSSTSSKIGRCVSECRFVASDGGAEVTVCYKCDSGD